MVEPLAPNLRLVHIDEDHVTGVSFNLVMLVWRHHTRLESYRAAIRLAAQTATLNPNGIGVMQVVERMAIPPDSATRTELGVMLRLPAIRHFCVTHEGSGFKAASVRAIVSAAHALARPVFPSAVHDDVASAARWAAAHNKSIGATSDAAGIEQALQSLRRLHVEQYPAPR
jgi:hypothetical protein